MAARSVRLAGAAFAVAACGIVPAVASADGIQSCKEPYESAQLLRREGRLRLSRAQLLVCQETCPVPLRTHCAEWQAEVERDLPTVLLEARTADGESVNDVRVLADDSPIVDPLAGKPVALDPGTHRVRFERSDGTMVELRVTLRAGEKDRKVLATFAGRATPPSLPPRRASPAPSAAPVAAGESVTLPLVLGAAGLGIAAVGAGLVVSGHVERGRLEDECAPRCAPDEGDAITIRWIAGGVMIGAGAVVIAAATWLYATRGSPQRHPHASAARAGGAPKAVFLRF